MKKLVSFLLALVLVFGLFALPASAAQERDPLLFRVAPATVAQGVTVIPISAFMLGPDLWILYAHRHSHGTTCGVITHN